MTRSFSCSALIVLAIVALHAQSAERVRVVAAPEGGAPAAAIAASDGTIHVLYEAGNEPSYARSADGGATFGAPLKLVDAAARKPGLNFSIDQAVLGKNGEVFAVLSNNAWQLKLPKDQWGLFYAVLPAGGKAFLPLQNTNHEPSQGFSIAADAKGDVALFWLKAGLYGAISRDGGKSFGAGAQLPSYNPCPCCTTSSAYGADGKLACLYREQTNDERDMYLVLIGDNGAQTRQKISTTPWSVNQCPMSGFDLRATKNGYTAVWPTKGSVLFARIAPDGKLLPPGEIKTPGRTGMHCGMLSLTAPSGDTLVAWNNDGKLGWQIFDAAGAAQGEAGSADTHGKEVAGVLAKDGNFVLFR